MQTQLSKRLGQLTTGLILGLLLMGVVSFALAGLARAAGPWFVDAATGSDGNSCLSTGSPCATIGAAITKASPGDTINVESGTYNEHLTIDKNLTLQGTGSPKPTIDGGSTDRVVTIDGSGITVYLYNFYITNGDASSAFASSRFGGGILVTNNATLRGQNLHIQNNLASSNPSGFGGGVAIDSASAYMTDTIIYNNTATRRTDPLTGHGRGGGLYLNIGTLHLVSSQVLSNVAAYRAAGGEVASGGGLHVNANSEVYLSNNLWQGNVARGSNSEPCDGGSCASGGDTEGGGAIGASFPTGTANLTISQDTFMGNIANEVSAPGSDNASRGGAIALNTTNTGGEITATLSDVLIKDNIAVIESDGTDSDDEGRGGAIYARHTSLKLERTQVYSNQAATTGRGSGGGIYVREPLADDRVDIINSILAGNRAAGPGTGAQVHAEYTNLTANNITTLVHTTLADDDLNPHEALFYQNSDASDTLMITNTIVASHSVGIQNVNATGKATARYMLFYGNGDNHPSPGTTAFPDTTGWVTGTDPLFVDPAGNDYHIQAGSPAIDQGTQTSVTDDIDGGARDATPDIGADEQGAEASSIYLPTVLKN